MNGVFASVLLATAVFSQDVYKEKTKVKEKDGSASYDSTTKVDNNGSKVKEDRSVTAKDSEGSVTEKTKVRSKNGKTKVKTEIKEEN